MIRVLHVLSGLNLGGAETMIMNLYRKIDRSQIQFDFVIHTKEHQVFYDEILAYGGRIFSFPPFKGTNWKLLHDMWSDFFATHPEYVILHSHVRSYASLYLPIAKKNGVKTIIHSHSTSNGMGFSAFIKKMMQFPLRYQADYFFACSIDAGEWLFGNKIVNGDKYYTLKNSIDIAKFRYNFAVREQYRKELEIGNKIAYIHVGRFHPAKNHDFLLRVFSEIHKQNKESVLILVGDGELREEIERQIRTLQLEDCILLLGAKRDISHLLQAADCFLFPSKWEGLGIAAVEAQAAGLRVICSDTLPKEAKLLEECFFLPLEVDEWVEKAVHLEYERKDVYEQIKESGYDIQQSMAWLSDFYECISRE